MATGKPSFLYKTGLSDPNLCMTGDARRIKKANKDKSAQTTESAEKVKQQAVAQVQHEGGNPDDETLVLSRYTLQFGQYYGQTFKWLLENALGYAAYLVDGMEGEKEDETARSMNKIRLP